MANRKKKIPLKNIDNELEEVDNTYMVTSDPKTKDTLIGEHVYINIPLYSKSARRYREMQFNKGLLTKEQYLDGYIFLSSGQMIQMNKTYDIELTPEVKELLRLGIVRGGGRTRTQKHRYQMETISREEEERRKRGDK